MKNSTLSCLGCSFWIIIITILIILGLKPFSINKQIIPSQESLAEYLHFSPKFICPEHASCKGHNVTCLTGYHRSGPIDDTALMLTKAAAYLRKETVQHFYPVYKCVLDASLSKKVDNKIQKELETMKKYFTLMTALPKNEHVEEYCKPVSQFIEKLGFDSSLTPMIRDKLSSISEGKLICVRETSDIGILSAHFLHSPLRILISFTASLISVLLVVFLWSRYSRYNIINNHIIPYIYTVLDENVDGVPVVFLRDGAREAFSYNFSQKKIDKSFKSAIDKLRRDSRYIFSFERFEGVPREIIKQINLVKQ